MPCNLPPSARLVHNTGSHSAPLLLALRVPVAWFLPSTNRCLHSRDADSPRLYAPFAFTRCCTTFSPRSRTIHYHTGSAFAACLPSYCCGFLHAPLRYLFCRWFPPAILWTQYRTPPHAACPPPLPVPACLRTPPLPPAAAALPLGSSLGYTSTHCLPPSCCTTATLPFAVSACCRGAYRIPAAHGLLLHLAAWTALWRAAMDSCCTSTGPAFVPFTSRLAVTRRHLLFSLVPWYYGTLLLPHAWTTYPSAYRVVPFLPPHLTAGPLTPTTTTFLDAFFAGSWDSGWFSPPVPRQHIRTLVDMPKTCLQRAGSPLPGFCRTRIPSIYCTPVCCYRLSPAPYHGYRTTYHTY